MKTRLILIYTLLLTTACGFHLRGSQLNGFDISNLYINSSSAPRLTKEVKSQLIGLNKSLASSSQGAAYIITLKDERFEKSVLSVSAKANNIPKDSNAATANKIPKKKRILGNSILDKDL